LHDILSPFFCIQPIIMKKSRRTL